MDPRASYPGRARCATSPRRAVAQAMTRQDLPQRGPDETLGHSLRPRLPGVASQLRIARPVSDVELAAGMHSVGLTLGVLCSFREHQGFDAITVGATDAAYHFEFTRSRWHPVTPSPTAEDLLVFCYPDETDWRLACERMGTAGFEQVGSFNPYWNAHGRTFQDHDGYRVILQQAAWTT